jgi:hypothetical protein
MGETVFLFLHRHEFDEAEKGSFSHAYYNLLGFSPTSCSDGEGAQHIRRESTHLLG